MTARRRLVPYCLLAPGLLWLIVFFVVPMYFMGELSLATGSSTDGLQVQLGVLELPRRARRDSASRSVRSFYYAGVGDVLALLIAYPLAYAIALRAARWRALLLFAVIAPFFTTYLIRTIAWKTILADDEPVVDVLQTLGLVPTTAACWRPRPP